MFDSGYGVLSHTPFDHDFLNSLAMIAIIHGTCFLWKSEDALIYRSRDLTYAPLPAKR